jgi:hypothetical protein
VEPTTCLGIEKAGKMKIGTKNYTMNITNKHMDSGGEDLCACESGIETPCKRFTQMIMEMERVRVEKTTRMVTTLSGFTAVAVERGWMMTVDETYEYVWTHPRGK